MYYYNKNIFDILLNEVYKITDRSFHNHFLFNFDLFENDKMSKLYQKLFKLFILGYIISLFVHLFVFADFNVKNNIKKAIAMGSQIYCVFFELYIKPNLYQEDEDLDKFEGARVLIEKHGKFCKYNKINNEACSYYSKNNKDNFMKLVDGYIGNLKVVMR